MSNQQYSEPAYAKSVDRVKFPFYQPIIDKKLVPESRESSAPNPSRAQITGPNVQRDQAWNIRAYPCTGLGTWLVPQLCKLPVYPEILKRVQTGETLVDVGCFIGHDLRRLAYDGAPSKNLYGVDIVSHWDIGYEMFHDQDHFDAHFILSDILSASDPALLALKGRVDIISITQVLHQWGWDGQLKAAKALATFTKPGSMIVGNQIGNPRAHESTLKSIGVPVWRHSPESFEKLWDQVGAETGTKWETQTWMRSFEEMSWDTKDGAWMEDGVMIIQFAVRRTQ
ncbi:hypothetical protein MMC11_007298 [Xylographa trunciseda]|nr:hypothetical protein [Xylographa trunciseda]